MYVYFNFCISYVSTNNTLTRKLVAIPFLNYFLEDYVNSRKSAIFQDAFIFAEILDSVVGFKYLDRKDHKLILF
jgi:hypothetical protein